jgi:hypothetical protein
MQFRGALLCFSLGFLRAHRLSFERDDRLPGPFGTERSISRCMPGDGDVRETGGIVQRSYDADYWRQRAEEARATAEAMVLPAAKREMWVVAEAYERLAEHAERTAGRRGSRESP